MTSIKKIDNTKRPTNIKLNKEDFEDYKSYKKEYDRQYALLKKERRKEIYRLNGDYKRNQQREYMKNNPQKRKEASIRKKQIYQNKSDSYKRKKLWDWRRLGIIVNDEIYERYVNTKHCELCNKEFCNVGGKTKHNTGCLDHDHLTGHVRCICCVGCNNFLRGLDTRRYKLNLEIHRYFKNI